MPLVPFLYLATRRPSLYEKIYVLILIVTLCTRGASVVAHHKAKLRSPSGVGRGGVDVDLFKLSQSGYCVCSGTIRRATELYECFVSSKITTSISVQVSHSTVSPQRAAVHFDF